MDQHTSAPRSCATCRHNTYTAYRINGEITAGSRCAKWLSCFPDATHCRDFEREPGSDDE